MSRERINEKNSGNALLERMPEAGALLRVARWRRKMSQGKVVERGNYSSRFTVMRWEQGQLPNKDTPKARERWIRIISCYSLEREEADEIFSLLNMEVLLDLEWGEIEASAVEIRSALDLEPTGVELKMRVGQKLPGDDRFNPLMGGFGLHMLSAEISATETAAEELMEMSRES